MSKQFRPYDPHQQYLFPPSISDWVPEDHIACFIGDVVDSLELMAILAKYERQDGRGAPAYHPAMLVRLLVDGYCTGFRKRHLRELAGLFLQVLKMCQAAGLVKLGHVSLDGTTMKANASKHKAMSYDRMTKAEKELQDDIRELLHDAEQTDQAEDARIMLDGSTKGFVQGYNAQAAVDSHTQIIIAADLTQQATDNAQLVPMLVKAAENLGQKPTTVTADAGYFSEAGVTAPVLAGIDLYIPPLQREDGSTKTPRAQHKTAVAMREKLGGAAGKAVYKLRKAIVEPASGQIKNARGIRTFLLRGYEQANAEWQLICLTHNLLKLFRARQPVRARNRALSAPGVPWGPSPRLRRTSPPPGRGDGRARREEDRRPHRRCIPIHSTSS